MGFSRQEYWSGLPFPTPGDLPDPRIEPKSFASPAWAGGFFNTAAPGKILSRILKKKKRKSQEHGNQIKDFLTVQERLSQGGGGNENKETSVGHSLAAESVETDH